MTKPIDAIMQKDMSRKDFIVTLGFGVVSILGLSTIIQLLTGKSYSGSKVSHSGYGASRYGL